MRRGGLGWVMVPARKEWYGVGWVGGWVVVVVVVGTYHPAVL